MPGPSGGRVPLCCAWPRRPPRSPRPGLVHLLLLGTPRPLSYFGWITGLLTAAAAVLPFLAGGSIGVALATSAIHLVIGLAIGSLVSGAAVSAIRTGPRPGHRPDLP